MAAARELVGRMVDMVIKVIRLKTESKSDLHTICSEIHAVPCLTGYRRSRLLRSLPPRTVRLDCAPQY